MFDADARPHLPTYLIRVAHQHVSQGDDGHTLDVVRHVAHGDVQQALERFVVAGAAVRQRDREDAAVPDEGVLVAHQLLDHRFRRLLLLVHDEGYPETKAANDLFVPGCVRES